MSSKNGYPFPTQSEIVSQLATDEAFRFECLGILVGRQTSDELETKSTKHTNKRGLRCSEASWMPALFVKIHNNRDEVTSEELDRLATVLPTYRKQLAAHFRGQMLAKNPELAAVAQKFGV